MTFYNFWPIAGMPDEHSSIEPNKFFQSSAMFSLSTDTSISSFRSTVLVGLSIILNLVLVVGLSILSFITVFIILV